MDISINHSEKIYKKINHVINCVNHNFNLIINIKRIENNALI